MAVLSLQGAFIEHERMLRSLGADVFEVRELADWHQHKDGLVLPGGESTTQAKLLGDLNLLDPIRADIEAGLPVFGTCAGLILLAKDIEGKPERRNAYGRQLGSFHTEAEMEGVGRIPMTFIRAPYIEGVSGSAKALATVDGHIVAARQGNQLVTAFHPELDTDTRVHAYFMDMMR